MIYHQPHNSRSNFNYNAYTYRNVTYAPHFHKNYELIYVLEGKLSLTVNGCSQTAEAGSMALVLSNQIHSFSPDKEAGIWVAVFAEEYVPGFAAMIKGKQGKSSVFQVDDSVKNLLRRMLIETEASRFMKKSCFYAVCDEYLRQITLEPRRGKDDFLVGKVLDWIALHYAEDISLKSVAEAVGYEYHYLSRLLNQSYGINFKQMVNRYRVEDAVELLQNGGLSAAEVALQSGFQSIRSFNHVFKEYTGSTPGEYMVR